jgi:pyruvate/2-oxoglutarate dehydrogenase complex dihydrolipoamide dehydrogenase (E3) component
MSTHTCDLAKSSSRRRARRVRGRLLRRRPRHESDARRHRAEPGRRLPVPRVHPVEGAAARGQAADHEVRHASPGVSLRRAPHRCREAAGWKDDVVGAHGRAGAALAQLRKVNYIQGRATILDADVVEARDGARAPRRRVRARDPGHRVAPTRVPGLLRQPARDGLDDGARDCRHPVVAARVGGGYIGLELGTVYAALGSRSRSSR